jgi:hypothetical protein
MAKKQLGLILTLFFTLFPIVNYAQSGTNASGGDGTGNGGTVSFSIGQTSYFSYKASNGSVSEGVQQPFEISVLSTQENIEGIQLSINVYPNPTSDFLTLSIANIDISDISFQLFDMQGKMLFSELVVGVQTEIFVKNLGSSTYILKVVQKNKDLKTFKIIKQ